MIANEMGARLLYRDAQGQSGEVALEGDETVYIGRALECAVRTDDAMVSRKHTLIRREGGQFVVEDLGSSNGTHVNDVRVERLALKHNDVVRCGNLWLRFVEDLQAAGPRQTDPGAGPGGPRPSPVPSVESAPVGAAGGESPAGMPAEGPRSRAPMPTPVPIPTPRPTMAQGSDSAPPLGPEFNSRVPTGAGGVASGPPTNADKRERLRVVHQRAAELERSLFSLQRQLIGAQKELSELLASVADLKDLTGAD